MREDSAQALLWDKLSIEYGISPLSIGNIKVAKGSALEVYTFDRKTPYIIEDPSLVRLAKLMSIEQQEPNSYKFKIIRRIFGLERVYGGVKTPFSQFKWRMSRKSPRGLTEMLLRMEKGVGDAIHGFGRGLEDSIYNTLAEKPPQKLFEAATGEMSPEELEGLLAELSDKKHPKVEIIDDNGKPIGILPTE